MPDSNSHSQVLPLREVVNTSSGVAVRLRPIAARQIARTWRFRKATSSSIRSRRVYSERIAGADGACVDGAVTDGVSLRVVLMERAGSLR